MAKKILIYLSHGHGQDGDVGAVSGKFVERDMVIKITKACYDYLLANNKRKYKVAYPEKNMGIGIPIGNYTSQYFANFYLSKFIHWLKEVKHVKFVDVYMDDIIILHSDKTYLHQLHLDGEQYLKQEVKLDIKDNWQIYLVDVRGIDFVGYKFYHDHIALRKALK